MTKADFCWAKRRARFDPLVALDVIKAKMVSRGCECVAVVEWEKMSDLECRIRRDARGRQTVLRVDIEMLFKATFGHQFYLTSSYIAK